VTNDGLEKLIFRFDKQIRNIIFALNVNQIGSFEFFAQIHRKDGKNYKSYLVNIDSEDLNKLVYEFTSLNTGQSYRAVVKIVITNGVVGNGSKMVWKTTLIQNDSDTISSGDAVI